MIDMKINRTFSVTAMILILVSTSIAKKDSDMSPALSSLVTAERAFARTSVEKGVRASFIEYFADDGLGFQPELTKIKEAFLKRPAPPTKPPVILDWRPVYADVALAGDLGYTTGPWTFTDQSPEKKPSRHGFYFSIWKKQSDGAWKVVIDCGITTPDHSSKVFEFRTGAEGTFKPSSKMNLEAEEAALVDLDRQFLRLSSQIGGKEAFYRYLADDARIHRNGMFPVVGRAAIEAYLSANPFELMGEPIKSDVARSGDLGYTYGSYVMTSGSTHESEKGYYVRVWKRDAKGAWKLVLDTLSPIPEEKK